jgi:hypothetical protein
LMSVCSWWMAAGCEGDRRAAVTQTRRRRRRERRTRTRRSPSPSPHGSRPVCRLVRRAATSGPVRARRRCRRWCSRPRCLAAAAAPAVRRGHRRDRRTPRSARTHTHPCRCPPRGPCRCAPSPASRRYRHTPASSGRPTPPERRPAATPAGGSPQRRRRCGGPPDHHRRSLRACATPSAGKRPWRTTRHDRAAAWRYPTRTCRRRPASPPGREPPHPAHECRTSARGPPHPQRGGQAEAVRRLPQQPDASAALQPPFVSDDHQPLIAAASLHRQGEPLGPREASFSKPHSRWSRGSSYVTSPDTTAQR